ncbi:MAG: hypothetical protein IT436_10205 [Phycisphaerales bacterium]|nr:hypothetical protein [Phycisphaerales bacterium]
MTRALLILFVINLGAGGWAVIRVVDTLALLQNGTRAQAWILWESGAVDFARRDQRYGFGRPIPETRDEFADFVLNGSVERQERAVRAAVAWLGISSAGLLGLAGWSLLRTPRAGGSGSPP